MFAAWFGQGRACETHCSFLHGYSISFEVVFGCYHLDERNWVFDFGGMKRAKTLIDGMLPEQWMKFMFDHTVLVAKDDPEIEKFRELSKNKVIQLRELENVGCEKFAQYFYEKLDKFIRTETNNRCFIVSVKCKEHEKNSATYNP